MQMSWKIIEAAHWLREHSRDSPIFLIFIALASVFLLVVTIKMFGCGLHGRNLQIKL
jgi:hypothetical protein